MDIIYSTLTEDIGVLHHYKLDHESSFESEKNTFEIQVPSDEKELGIGLYIYANGTEYGGRIDDFKLKRKTGDAFYSGRTWRGIFGSKVIEPSSGQPYYIVNGNVITVLQEIITKISLTDVFTVNGESEVNVAYQFPRYCNSYNGVFDMLKAYGLKPVFTFNEVIKKCEISVSPIEDFSQQKDISSDAYIFEFTKSASNPNHIIALGRGHLEHRDVVHRYVNGNGDISSTQFYFGADEKVYLYNYGNVEDHEELVERAEEKLSEEMVSDTIKINVENVLADIGDKFSVYDEEYKLQSTQYIYDKIVKIDDGFIRISYNASAVTERKELQEEEVETGDIPTALSELENDVGYQTEQQVQDAIEQSSLNDRITNAEIETIMSL